MLRRNIGLEDQSFSKCGHAGSHSSKEIPRIDQFRYIKIQPQTIDLSTRLWGMNTEFVGVYSPEPRSEVYCLRLNFNISKLVYWYVQNQFKLWILSIY